MSFYKSGALSRYGVFGAFAGGAPELFSGGPTFIGGDDQSVFLSTGSGANFWGAAKGQGISYNPPSSALLQQIQDKWFSMKQSANPVNTQFITNETGKLNQLLNTLYIAIGNHSFTGYSQDAVTQVYAAAQSLKAELNAIAGFTPAAEPAQTQILPATMQMNIAAGGGGATTYPSTTSGGGATQIPGGGGVTILGQQQGAATGAPDNTLLYIGIGVGAIVLIGGLVYMRKRASTSGYRHRRRRR